MAGAGVGSGGTMVLPAYNENHAQLQSHIEPASFVAHQRAQTCGSAQLRMQRVIVAAVSGIALLVLVAVLQLGATGSSTSAVEMEMLKAIDLSDGSSATQSGRKTIDVAALVAEGEGSVKEKMKALQKTAGKEEAKASALDKKVVAAEERLKSFVLKAKREQTTGAESEVQAKEDVSAASVLRRKAQKLRDESEKARREFVAQEKPVEMATKLATHDHHDYRKDELAVAQEVAVLSEHPTDPKLRAKVDKLVKESKVAKGRMAEDQQLLTKLEKQTASARLGGTKGYTHLRAQSVHIAKKAEGLADEAVTLAKEGHSMKDKARRLVTQVEEKMKKPDELHEEAAKERGEYKSEMAQVAALQQALHRMRDASLKQEDEAKKADKDKYSGMRSELEREVGEKGGKEGAAKTREEDRLKVAKDSYDELEELEMKKERARLQAERQHDLSEGDKERGAGSGEELAGKALALKTAEERAHILSAKQSTFLSGLFSNKAPWDTKRNIAD